MSDIDICEILTVNLAAYYLLMIISCKYVNICVKILSVFVGSSHEINIKK